MPTPTDRIGLDTFADGELDWDHTDTVEHVDNTTRVSVLTTGNFTASGGSTPAATETVSGVSTDETVGIVPVVGVNNATTHGQSYAFNVDDSAKWDGSQWNVTLTVNWDTDPGSTNDTDMNYRIYEE